MFRVRKNGVATAAAGLLLAATAVWPLDPAKRIDEHQLTSWSTQRGLPGDHINALAQTPDGYLWLATPTGLVRFDGSRFVVFDKRNTGEWPSDDIAGLLAGRDGSLWITHSPAGLTRLYKGRFESFHGPESHSPVIAEDSGGAIWLATDSGLCRFQDGRFTTFGPPGDANPPKVWWVSPDPKGFIWFATPTGLGQAKAEKVLSFRTRHRFQDEVTPWVPRDGRTVKSAPPADLRLMPGTQLLESPGLHIRLADGAYVDAASTLHMPTRDGLVQYRPGELIGSHVPAMVEHPPTAMRRDRDRTLWVGLRGLGLCRFASGELEEPAAQSPLRSIQVSAILEDKEGSLWIGTQGAGLFRLIDGDVSRLPYPEGIAGAAQTVFEDSRGSLWVGVRDALLRYAGGRWTKFDARSGLQGLPVLAIAEAPGGALYFGTQDGFLHQFREGAFKHFWLAGPVNDFGPITALSAAPDGALWIGTGWRGAARWKDGNLLTFRVEDGLSTDRISAIAASQSGEIWIGTPNGLNRVRNEQVQRFTTRDGLACDAVTALYSGGRGALWIGTNGGGLSRWQNGVFRNFTHRDGLPGDVVLALVDDGAALWLGSRKGVFRAPVADLEALDPGRPRVIHSTTFDETDGLPSRSIGGEGQPAACKGANGRLWFATERGIAFVDAGGLSRTRTAPAVLLEQATLNGSDFSAVSYASVPPGPGNLSFTYTAATLRDAERVRFRYLLEGFDKEWQDAGARRQVQYTSVPPGEYRLHLSACLPDGPCGDGASIFAFRLRPRFYQTAWFPALCAAALLLLLWAAHLIRLRLLRREFASVLAERTRIAGELHDGLLQNLMGVLGILDAAGPKLLDTPAAAKQALDRGRFLLRECLAQARQSVWDIRKPVDATDSLSDALERIAAELRPRTSSKIELAIQGQAKPLDSTVRENLLRIAREAMVNAIRHAGAGTIRLEGAYSAQRLRLSIHDDGRGFSPGAPAPPASFGLLGMRERAKRIGAELEIRSAPDKGCEVLLLVPLLREPGGER